MTTYEDPWTDPDAIQAVKLAMLSHINPYDPAYVKDVEDHEQETGWFVELLVQPFYDPFNLSRVDIRFTFTDYKVGGSLIANLLGTPEQEVPSEKHEISLDKFIARGRLDWDLEKKPMDLRVKFG